MTKSLKAILIVIAAALIFVIAGGLIIHFVRNGKDSGTIDTLKGLQTGQNEVFLDIKSTKISEKSSRFRSSFFS